MCPIDPNSLKIGSPLTILEDRECINCGYNLKGLRSDAVCPECGRPIHARRRDIPRYSDALVNAPKLWLAGFALGSAFLFAGALALLFMFIVMALIPGPAKFASAIFAIGAAAIWYLGVFITTQPRPMMPATRIDPKKEWAALRWTARLTQFFWLGVPALLAVYWHQYKAGAAPPESLAWAAFACFVLAAVGLIWLCVYLSNIAFWGDDDVGANFRTGAWMIGAAAFLGVLNIVNMLTGAVLMGGFWASLVHILFMFFIIAPEFYLVYCLFQLQHMARWSLTNHSIADAKTRRLKAQALRNAKRGAAAPTSKIPEEGAIPLAEDSSVNPASARPERAPIRGSETNILPRSEHGDTPYDVEDR